MNCLKTGFALIIFLLTVFGTAMAQQPTKVVVRAKAKDAKFIGSYNGGAMITIKNAQTGEVLAKGLTTGSTGNTTKLIKTPKKRYEQISTKRSAKFTAMLNVDEPIYVNVSATSTYRNTKEVTSSTQLWIIPGRDITGDGIILELPGFVVDVFDIQSFQTEGEGRGVKFKTKVVMMCGCSTEPGGLWNSSKFKMKAMLKQNGEIVQKTPLKFSGKTSIYEGSFEVNSPGSYKIIAYAFDPRTENSGVAVETIVFD